jgi:hypothetical protein
MLDVLVTSYHTLANEFNQMVDEERAKKGGPPSEKKQRSSLLIFDVHFHRVVLDEAHMVSR